MMSEPIASNLRIFVNHDFARFAHKRGIAEKDLCSAASRLQMGSVDADLGSGLFKQRIARQGQGKSGGFRTILIFRAAHAALFVHGFAKNDQANISRNDLLVLRRFAKEFLQYGEQDIKNLIDSGAIQQICQSEALLPQ